MYGISPNCIGRFCKWNWIIISFDLIFSVSTFNWSDFVLYIYIYIYCNVLFYSIWYSIYFYVSIDLEFWILWNSTFMYVFFIPYPWYLLFTLSVIIIYVLSVFLYFLGVLFWFLFCWLCLWLLFLPIVSAFFDSAVFENGFICFLAFGIISQVGECTISSTSNDIYYMSSRQILSTTDKPLEWFLFCCYCLFMYCSVILVVLNTICIFYKISYITCFIFGFWHVITFWLFCLYTCTSFLPFLSVS